MHKYVVERIKGPGALPYWLVRHVFYRRETRVTKTIAKVYQPSFAVRIAAALNTLEHRKTGQRKPPVQKVGSPSASHNNAMDAIALQKSLFTLFKKYMSSADSSILVKEVLVVVQQHQ